MPKNPFELGYIEHLIAMNDRAQLLTFLLHTLPDTSISLNYTTGAIELRPLGATPPYPPRHYRPKGATPPYPHHHPTGDEFL